jgi:ribonuclease BN (tRNA processing enzyme)
MEFIFLGTCAGTLPQAGRHHASVALKLEDQTVFLDAGENCSYTACLMDVDLLSVRHILISHPHMDHVGGLGNLLWNFRKQRYLRKESPAPAPVTVHLPVLATYDGVMTLLRETEGDFACDFEIRPHVFADGVVVDEPGLRISAMHNSHLPRRPGAGWRAYSFLIEAQGKRVVYSGDVGAPQELDCWADCDLMMIETGHHQPEAVARHFAGLEKRPGKLVYVHSGRTILADPAGQQALVREIYGDNAVIAYDTMRLTL